jgi:hypothetical protein
MTYNAYLKADLKLTSIDISLVEARFIYGMALLGLAILHDAEKTSANQNNNSGDDEQDCKNIEYVVQNVTRAMAPILLPMIDGLGALDTTDVVAYSAAGEAD